MSSAADPRIQETVMALLSLTMFEDGPATRAWKGHDFAVMDARHERGWIANPKGKAKSVVLTDEGRAKAEELFAKYFGDEAQRAGGTLESAVYVRADYDAVWNALATAEGYAGWSSAPCLEFGRAPGDAVVWGEGDREVYRGVLVSIEKGKGFAHTFAFRGFDFDEETSCRSTWRSRAPWSSYICATTAPTPRTRRTSSARWGGRRRCPA